MITEHVLEIHLVLRGPVLIKSSNSLAFGLDAALSRVAFGPHEGKVCLPGTLLKGKLAEALTQLGETVTPQSKTLEDFCKKWLGETSPDGDDPYRGRLVFGDLIVLTPEERELSGSARRYRGEATRHRITIDDELGSVEAQHLQVIEMPFAPGRPVVAQGEGRFFAEEQQAMQIERFVRTGLRWLVQVGADRTVGFGQLLEAKVSRAVGRGPKLLQLKSEPLVALALAIRPLRPLCIAKPKIGDNLFESESIIPGNVLKGAVAETWAALLDKRSATGVAALGDETRAELSAHFNELIFRHAFPALQTSSGRPAAVPLSVVKADGSASRYWDLAKFGCPVVFRGAQSVAAPAFRTDWKGEDFGEVDPHFGWALPEKELRVRTAIDSVKRRADKGSAETGIEPEGKLFAWEMVHPWQRESRSGEGKFVDRPVVWHSRIDLTGVSNENDRRAVAEQLAALLSQLGFVSKTKAVCEVEVTPVYGEADLPAGETLALVLQTPALLADPRFPEDGGPGQTGSITAERMRELYTALWRELSGESLSLRHYFAAQSLAGGSHLHHRFQQPAGNGKAYAPWLLTDAGSVFVFDVKNAVAAKIKVRDWLRHGLPLPGKLEARFTADWRHNPYLRANGFGEVAIHQPHGKTPSPSDALVERLTPSAKVDPPLAAMTASQPL